MAGRDAPVPHPPAVSRRAALGGAEQPGDGAVQGGRELGETGDVEAGAVLEAAQRLVGAGDPEPAEPGGDLLLGETQHPTALPQSLADLQVATGLEVTRPGQLH